VIDLTRYRDSSATLGLIGVPGVINDLLPVIEREICDGTRSQKAISSYLKKRLPALFGWLQSMHVEVGPASVPANVAAFTHADGALLKHHPLRLGGELKKRQKQLSALLNLIERVRGLAEPLLWPTIEVDQKRLAHSDVDPDAVRYL
jgi:hypothetical protein